MSADLSICPRDASAVGRCAPGTGVRIGHSRLRAPQREVYAVAREHFSRTAEPAIIQMLVGCGKSGLAGLLALGLSGTRTPIVTPNTTIRRGIAEEIDPCSLSSF
jgi:DNA repair protein RadD